MVLKVLLFSLSALVFLGSCSAPENEPNPEKEVPKGQALFVNNCASCHGMDGRLGLSGASDLGVSQLSNEEVISVLKKGRNAMPSFEAILKTQANIEAVAVYTLELRK